MERSTWDTGNRQDGDETDDRRCTLSFWNKLSGSRDMIEVHDAVRPWLVHDCEKWEQYDYAKFLKWIEELSVQKEKTEAMEQYWYGLENFWDEKKSEVNEKEKNYGSIVSVPYPSVTWHENLHAYMLVYVGWDEMGQKPAFGMESTGSEVDRDGPEL
ncbi:uncharacterized protein C8R40DRAFT_1068595 [Lentinula edodes]|uniref:uncharacterized protein n=1 Tax=Lentinula edodes TaxID=5353 RepID=UPI001E8E3EA0|nr:uncharacterized protein C8R40DRAFT_1068595 [Lentinula edodes]KAH7876847.1 hypothetical protein C8R40DRAFT_1068595 [Lentinula edodes]